MVTGAQNRLPNSSAASVSSRISNSSRRDDKEYFFGHETLEDKWKTTDFETTSFSSVEDWLHSESSFGSRKYVDRETLTVSISSYKVNPAFACVGFNKTHSVCRVWEKCCTIKLINWVPIYRSSMISRYLHLIRKKRKTTTTTSVRSPLFWGKTNRIGSYKRGIFRLLLLCQFRCWYQNHQWMPRLVKTVRCGFLLLSLCWLIQSTSIQLLVIEVIHRSHNDNHYTQDWYLGNLRKRKPKTYHLGETTSKASSEMTRFDSLDALKYPCF